MTKFSIVLHTHTPYVEGFGTWPFGEEWLVGGDRDLLPAAAGRARRPSRHGHALDHAGAGRPAGGAGRARALPGASSTRSGPHTLDEGDGDAPAEPLAYSRARYETAAKALERRGDLLAAFRPHVRWTSAATHAVLPLLATDAGVRLQVETGIASHRKRFGSWDGGFWLPECAHAPWLDELLEEAGVHTTCVDWTDVTDSRAPHRSEAGIVLQPLDREAIDLVLARARVPSHADYRDSYRLTPRAHAVWANDGTPYDPERGAARARADALDVARVPDGAVVAFDTELFGHHCMRA